MDREEKKIIGLTTVSHSLVHLFEGALPPLIPLLILEFGTDYFHLGIIVTIFSYAFGLGSLPAGFLADRFGPKRLITIYLFLGGIFSVCILPVGSLLMYGVIMGLVGLFCSTYHPASNTLISLRIKEKGKAFGIHGIAGSLGVAIVPVLSAWLGSSVDWRAPHVIFGFFGIAAAFYSLSISGHPVAKPDPPPEKSEAPSQGIAYVNVIVFFMSVTAMGLTYKGIMTFLPAYMGENFQVHFLKWDPVALGGTVTTIALLSGAVGQYIAGRLVDRFKAENLYLGSVVIGTIFVFLMAESTNALLLISAVIYAFFFFSTQPIQNYLLSNYFPSHRQGLGYGIQFFLTFGVGSTAAAVSGYLADNYGLKSVFYFMGFFLVLSCLLVLCLVISVRDKGKNQL